MSAAELGFERQPFVRWFHPWELARAGVRSVLADMFGAYADKRELQAALHPRIERLAYDYTTLDADDPSAPERAELWLDFVADVGDGFHATYAIASLLARQELLLRAADGSEHHTQRGAVLVMGGDEVYPAPSRLAYEQRTVGPYRAALPYVADEARAPHLFAIPGNHDWYDGLSAFLRQFTQKRWVGGWRTRQERSYFVLALPHRVWLWGIDIQLHAGFDGPQLAYFDSAAAQLEQGDRVILCTAEPSWVKAEAGQREGYRNLAFVESKVIARGARVELVLTGDSHHYARYVERHSGRVYVTAGGGGAFLHGTHTLPSRIELPASRAEPDGARAFTLESVFPSRRESLGQVRQLVRFSMHNRAFALLWGGVWLILGWCLFSASLPAQSTFQPSQTFVGALAGARNMNALLAVVPFGSWSVGGVVVAIAVLVLLSRRRSQRRSAQGRGVAQDGLQLVLDLASWLSVAAAPTLVFGTAPVQTLLAALARSPTAAGVCLVITVGGMAYVSHAKLLVRFAVGLVHASLHVLGWLLIAALTARPAVALASLGDATGLFLQLQQLLVFVGWVVVSAALAGLASATVFGLYLWFAGNYLPKQLNDAFAALAIEDYKNFIRLHIDRAGRLILYPVGLRKVPRAWELSADGSAEAPFIVHQREESLDPELIEPPLVLGRTGAG